LLNIGPGPDGTWYDEAYERLDNIGDWLKINGNAIYSTRPISPYLDGKLRYTQGKDGSVNIIYLLAENEKIPAEIQVKGFIPVEGAKISMLGKNGSSLKWKPDGAGLKISIPAALSKTLLSEYAVVLKVDRIIK
jgi:alpha-L-fucosidase